MYLILYYDVMNGDTIEYRCISVEDLLSYDPADVYIEDTVYYVKLRHGLVSTPLC